MQHLMQRLTLLARGGVPGMNIILHTFLILKYMNIYTLKKYSNSLMHQNCTNCFQFETFRCLYEPFTFKLKPLGAYLVLYFHFLSHMRLHINNLQLHIYVHQKTLPGVNFMHHYLLVNYLIFKHIPVALTF